MLLKPLELLNFFRY